MRLAALFLAIAPAIAPAIASDDQLVVPRWQGRLALDPTGAHLLLRDRTEAWLLDPDSLEPRMGIEVGPYHRSGDHWTGARFSADGTRLALWSFRGAGVLVDTEDLRVVRRLPAPDHSGRRDGFAGPNARRIGQLDQGRLIVHDLATGGVPFELATVNAAVFSADGRWIYADTPGGVDRIDLEDPSGALRLTDPGWERLVALRGERLLLLRNNRVECVDLGTGATHGEDLTGTWTLGAVSPDESIVLLWNHQGRVAARTLPDLQPLWEVEGATTPSFPGLIDGEGRQLLWMHHPELGTGAFDLASGEHLWSASTNAYWSRLSPPLALGDRLLGIAPYREGLVWFDADGVVLERVPSPVSEVLACGRLWTGAPWYASSSSLRVLDPESGEVRVRRAADTPWTWVRAHGEWLLAVDDKREGHLFRGPDLEPSGTFPAGYVAEFLTDGKGVVAYGGQHDGALVFDLEGRELARAGKGMGVLRRARASAGGKVIAGIDPQRGAHLWHEGREVPLAGAGADVRAIAIDAEGRWLAIGTQPPQVQVFDTTSGAKIAEFTPAGWFPFGGDVRTLQFDHGGGRLIGTTGDSGSVQVWNTEDWSLVWWHDYSGGNPGALQTAVDAKDRVLGVWGMTLETPRLFALADGDVLADLAGTGMEDLAPALGATLASRRGSLIALDGAWQIEFEWLDVGDHGTVRFDGESLSGPPAALRQVFVRTQDGLVRGDTYADD